MIRDAAIVFTSAVSACIGNNMNTVGWLAASNPSDIVQRSTRYGHGCVDSRIGMCFQVSRGRTHRESRGGQSILFWACDW